MQPAHHLLLLKSGQLWITNTCPPSNARYLGDQQRSSVCSFWLTVSNDEYERDERRAGESGIMVLPVVSLCFWKRALLSYLQWRIHTLDCRLRCHWFLTLLWCSLEPLTWLFYKLIYFNIFNSHKECWNFDSMEAWSQPVFSITLVLCTFTFVCLLRIGNSRIPIKYLGPLAGVAWLTFMWNCRRLLIVLN